MVEADEHHPVDGVRCRNKARDPIDGEVGPFRLLDLDEEPHLLAGRPVKHFDKCRDPCPGKELMKPGSRIETADPLETQIGCEAMAVDRSVDREVMQNDRLAVRGQHDVDLDHRCAPGFRRLESRKRVLWVVVAVVPVDGGMVAPDIWRNTVYGNLV